MRKEVGERDETSHQIKLKQNKCRNILPLTSNRAHSHIVFLCEFDLFEFLFAQNNPITS